MQAGSKNVPQETKHFPYKMAKKIVFPRERAEGRFPRGGSRDRVVPLSKRWFLPEEKITPPKGRFSTLRERLHTTSLLQWSWQGRDVFLQPSLFFQDVDPVLQGIE